MEITSKVNNAGREFEVGKALTKDLRRLIIIELLDGGADEESRCVPRGLNSKTARKFRIFHSTATNQWIRYCESLSVDTRQGAVGRHMKLGDDEDQ